MYLLASFMTDWTNWIDQPFDLELLIRVLRPFMTIIAFAVSIFQVKSSVKSRKQLKQDLQILKLLNPEDPEYKHEYEMIKKNISKRIKVIYSSKQEDERLKRKELGVRGSLSLSILVAGTIIFGYASFVRVISNNYWFLLTGLLALCCLIGVLILLSKAFGAKVVNSILAVVWVSIFAYCTYYFVQVSSWWALLTGFFTFTGLLWLIGLNEDY